MTWEETIIYIRTQPQFTDLVKKAYLDERLDVNVELYMKGDEWKETLRLLNEYLPLCKSILDVGSGNGISAIAFALSGYNVTVLEPDTSNTIGSGAIKILKEQYLLSNIQIIEAFAENAGLKTSTFDLVYCRQSLHHALDLNAFIRNITNYLKPGGIFLSVRDHVIYNKKDKTWFLESHPLHKYYGGENAYKTKEYRNAIKNAGLVIIKELKHFDNCINYFPLTNQEYAARLTLWENLVETASKKMPFASSRLVFPLFRRAYICKNGNAFDERIIPGRLYSYVARKR